MLYCDEGAQVPAEFLSIINIILRRIKKNNIFSGGLLIMFTTDYTQIQPIKVRPLLISTHAITCFKMVTLKTSVRASGNSKFQRAQHIARYNYRRVQEEPNLVE